MGDNLLKGVAISTIQGYILLQRAENPASVGGNIQNHKNRKAATFASEGDTNIPNKSIIATHKNHCYCNNKYGDQAAAKQIEKNLKESPWRSESDHEHSQSLLYQGLIAKLVKY